MPIYRNDHATDTYRGFGMELAPGETGHPAPDKYIINLSVKAPNLTVVQGNQAPWVTLHAGNPPFEMTEGLARYNQIQIVNGTGDLVTIVVNGDETRPKVILDGKLEIIMQDREIDAMKITGVGASGGVYVYGME